MHPPAHQGFTAGGYQPYTRAGGRYPGAALVAMLRGAPAFMPNPMDARRMVQRQAAARGGVTLLDLLRR